MQRIFGKNYIMDENDSFSEHFKIPLGHNRTNLWRRLLQNQLQS